MHSPEIIQTSMLIDIIVGTRPNFMKAAAIIHALNAAIAGGSKLEFRLIHTGQHYDEKMSANFFNQLNIPLPDINFGVGSGTQAEQTALIMIRYEQLLMQYPSKICLVLGDVNSSMACAIVAQKLGVKVGHVEGGIRSGDWTMPEEINRLIVDSISNWFFTTSKYANENLKKLNIDPKRIFFVGNTMIDTLVSNMQKLTPPIFWDKCGLNARKYMVLTLHRPSNVDRVEKLEKIIALIAESAPLIPVVFPVHPRTSSQLKEISNIPTNFILVEPLPYLEFNFLVKNAVAVITDSGGITEETTYMNIPCITMRPTTERPETVEIGTNILVGDGDSNELKNALVELLEGGWKQGAIPEKWDGNAGERIVLALEQIILE